MLFSARQISLSRHKPEGSNSGMPLRCAMIGAGFLLVATVIGPAQSNQVPLRPPRSAILPDLNRIPDANEQMAMQTRRKQEQFFAAANIERQRQIMLDSAALLHMATALKAKVDSADKDMSAADALFEIEGIEKLAHAVKEKMKLTIAPK